MGRWRPAAATLMLLTGCGGSSSPVAPMPPVQLPDGAYTLSIYSVTLGCFVSTFMQGAAPNSAISAPVRVTADGPVWRVAPESGDPDAFLVTLEKDGYGVSGTANGTLVMPTVAVTLQNEVSGTPNGTNAGVIGSVDGGVTYAGGSGTAFCATNMWSLK